MKNYLKIIVFLGLVASISSCSTFNEVTISGNPNTEIYTPKMSKIGVIGADGKLSFKISSKEDIYAFLISRNVGTNEFIPFALDYNYKNSAFTKEFSGGFCSLLGILYAGLGLALPELAPVGLGCMGIGLPMYIWSHPHNKKVHGQDKFIYLASQRTNEDLKFVPIKDVGLKKMMDEYERASADVSSERTNLSTDISSTSINQTLPSKQSLRNYGELLVGNYLGTGYLEQAGKVIEEYATIKVLVKQTDNNSVNVDIIENGSSYFNTTNKYLVKKKGKNTYVLSLDGISGPVITIDNTEQLRYIHPNVNIDGEVYTLKINAKKMKSE